MYTYDPMVCNFERNSKEERNAGGNNSSWVCQSLRSDNHPLCFDLSACVIHLCMIIHIGPFGENLNIGNAGGMSSHSGAKKFATRRSFLCLYISWYKFC